MQEPLPDGYTAPVCQALLTPMLWNGVPRTAGILNAMSALVALLAWHWWWYLPVALAIHGGLRLLTAWDPYFIQILGRALQCRDYYEA